MIIMTSLIKRISKDTKNLNCCIVVGNAFGNLEEVSNAFNTVFIMSTEMRDFKKRNIVYRSSFDNIVEIPYIDAVFFDADQLEHIPKLETVLKKCRVIIYIGSKDIPSLYYFRFLESCKYEVTEIQKHYHKWTPKR
jgi:hypothetical protein